MDLRLLFFCVEFLRFSLTCWFQRQCRRCLRGWVCLLTSYVTRFTMCSHYKITQNPKLPDDILATNFFNTFLNSSGCFPLCLTCIGEFRNQNVWLETTWCDDECWANQQGCHAKCHNSPSVSCQISATLPNTGSAGWPRRWRTSQNALQPRSCP